jgi:hypothetical protein
MLEEQFPLPWNTIPLLVCAVVHTVLNPSVSVVGTKKLPDLYITAIASSSSLVYSEKRNDPGCIRISSKTGISPVDRT